MFGTALDPTEYRKANGQGRDVIGRIDTSPAGNVVLEIGVETALFSDEYVKTAHVVLTPDETIRLITRLAATLAGRGGG